MLRLIALGRPWINPYLTIHDAYREAAHVICEGVEGAAAGQVEPGVVPMAGQNAVTDAAAIQGESHVGQRLSTAYT